VRRCPYQEFDQHTLAANEKLLCHWLVTLREGSASAFCNDRSSIEEHKTTMEITVEENDELQRL
jgi:hypothetical protein